MRCRFALRWIRLIWLTGVRGSSSTPLPFVLAFAPRSYGGLEYHTIHTFMWSRGKTKGEPVGSPCGIDWVQGRNGSAPARSHGRGC